MAVDLLEMRSAYAHIELYEILQGAVLEAEKFMTRTKDLQTLTHQLGEALLKIETHMKQLEGTPVRHYVSAIEQIQHAYTNAGPVVEEANCCTRAACVDLHVLHDILASRGIQKTGTMLETRLLAQVVDNAKELMRSDSILLFKDICRKSFSVAELSQEQLLRLAAVNDEVRSILSKAEDLCQSGHLSLGPFLRSVAGQMNRAIQDSRRSLKSYRLLRRWVEAMGRSVGAVGEAVGMNPHIECSICFENGRHAKCSYCDTATCAGCYAHLLKEKLHNGNVAEWEKFSKYGCILPQCSGTIDIRTSLSDEAGLFFALAPRCFL